MLNRRHIRIKVLQLLYSKSTADSKTKDLISEYNKRSINFFRLYILNFLLFEKLFHEFSKKEGEQISDAVEAIGGQRPWTKCIDGEALTWFGSHTLSGLRVFNELCKDLKTAKE